MIDLSCNQARLKYIMDISSIISNEAIFESKKTMFETRSFSDDRSRMLKIDIKITAFDKYETNGFKFFIDTNKINAFLNSLKLEDSINFKLKDDKIRVSSKKAYRNTPLLDIISSNIPEQIPEIPFDFEALINSQDFVKGIKISDLESDCVVFDKPKDDYLRMLSINEDSCITIDDLKIITDVKSNLYALYFIDFFNNILRFFPDYINIKMQSGENKAYPIIISFDLLDNIGKITYIIAPRVLSD